MSWSSYRQQLKSQKLAVHNKPEIPTHVHLKKEEEAGRVAKTKPTEPAHLVYWQIMVVELSIISIKHHYCFLCIDFRCYDFTS